MHKSFDKELQIGFYLSWLMFFALAKDMGTCVYRIHFTS